MSWQRCFGCCGLRTLTSNIELRSRATGMNPSPRSPATGMGRFNDCAGTDSLIGLFSMAMLAQPGSLHWRANRQGLTAAARRLQARAAYLGAASAQEAWRPGGARRRVIDSGSAQSAEARPVRSTGHASTATKCTALANSGCKSSINQTVALRFGGARSLLILNWLFHTFSYQRPNAQRDARSLT